MKEIIYQMLPRLWGEGKLSSVDDATLKYLEGLGITALWLTGIPRHASGKDFVKGDPGSPYAISDYYDINPYLTDGPGNRLEEFVAATERVHSHGMRLIIDMVPNHVAPDYSDGHGGIPLHDYHDYDWSDTVKINYDDPRAVRALSDIVLFWASKGVDGFRCDMVELVPVQALREIIAAARRSYPGLIFIGEAYDRANYEPLLGAGFDYLYDKSGMYDSLFAIVRGGMFQGLHSDASGAPLHSDASGIYPNADADVRRLTWGWQALGAIRPRMLTFLENHDEVRFCSRDYAGRFPVGAGNDFSVTPDPIGGLGSATALLYERAPLAVAALLTEAPFMLYFGQELGITASESGNCRTSIFNWSDPAELRALWNYIHGPLTGDGTGPESRPQANRALSDSQLECLEMFRSTIALAQKLGDEPMFDLCYCQPTQGQPGEIAGFDLPSSASFPGLIAGNLFDPVRHFAFLRGRTLVFCNFAPEDATLDLQIPRAASELNGVKESPVRINCRAFGIEVLELPAGKPAC